MLTAVLWAGPELAPAADGPAPDRLLTGSAADGDLGAAERAGAPDGREAGDCDPEDGGTAGCDTGGCEAEGRETDGCEPGANPVTLITTRQVMAANAKTARARGRRRRGRDGAAARAGASRLSAAVSGGPAGAGA